MSEISLLQPTVPSAGAAPAMHFTEDVTGDVLDWIQHGLGWVINCWSAVDRGGPSPRRFPRSHCRSPTPDDHERQAELDQCDQHDHDADDDEGKAAVLQDLLAPRAGRAGCRLSWR